MERITRYMESQPRNPEFIKNPETFHSYLLLRHIDLSLSILTRFQLQPVRPQGHKTFMVNSTEHEIYHAHKC